MKGGFFNSSLMTPSWWNINNIMKPINSESQSILLPSSSPPSTSSSSHQSLHPPSLGNSMSTPPWQEGQNQQIAESWSQLILGRLSSEDEKLVFSSSYLPSSTSTAAAYKGGGDDHGVVKQEVCDQGSCSHGSDHHLQHQEAQYSASTSRRAAWNQFFTVSSPISSVTTTSCYHNKTSNMLDFSIKKEDVKKRHAQQADQSSESNRTSAGAGLIMKKAKVKTSSSACAQSSLKVRKEKLGDRITALHQLVSPFGKTDTASVLLEAIGYIRFLHTQIEAMSSPYMHIGRSCIFPEDPGQLLNQDSSINGALKKQLGEGAPMDMKELEPRNDLMSRGLCLVPVSCTALQVVDGGGWPPVPPSRRCHSRFASDKVHARSLLVITKGV